MPPLRVLLLLALSASLWAPASDAQAHAGDATGFASVTIREAVVS